MKEKIYAIVDIETTGTDIKVDRMIQFGCVLVQGGKIVSQFATDVNPGRVIPKNIQMLTGITNSQVAKAPYFEDIAYTISQLLSDCIFVAHNIHFDLNFLNAEIQRCGYPILQLKGIDTVELAQIFMPTSLSYRLGDLSKELNLQHDNPHQADSDAYVTAGLFLELTARMRRLPLITLEKISILSDACTMDTGAYIKEILIECQEVVAPLKKEWQIVNGLAIRRQEMPLYEEKQYKVTKYPKNKQQKIKLYENALTFRSEQSKMMNEIYKYFTEEDTVPPLFIEAETGLGKTIAYLLPLSYIATPEKPVVISTTSILLEEQLIYKDIPLLNQILPHPLQPVLLKSHRYYIDLARFYQTLQKENEMKQYRFYQMSVLVWLTMTTTGDLTELKQTTLTHVFWEDIQHFGVAYLNKESAFYEFDFLRKRKHQEKQANVLITNHTYLCYEAYRKVPSLPKTPFLIIDEAHHFPEIAEKVGSGRLSIKKWQQQKETLLEIWDHIKANYPEERYFYFFETLLNEAADKFVGLGQFLVGCFSNQEESEIILEKSWYENLADYPRDLFKKISIQLKEWQEISGQIRGTIEENWHLLQGIEKENTFKFLSLLTEMDEACVFYLNYFTDWSLHQVRWIHRHKQNIEFLGSDFESSQLPTKSWYAQYEKVFFTGGTLKAGNLKDFLPNSLGIAEYQFKTMKSPFDYEKQARLFVCKDFPMIRDMNQETYVKELAQLLKKIMKTENRPVLVLFSSLEVIQEVYYKLHTYGVFNGREVLAQGVSGNNFKILKRFRSTENAILLGADSFWEGIDLPGETLQILVVARLPFAPPYRPVERARRVYMENKGESAFYQHDLPKAAMRLKQGFGRLIRSEEDKGVMIVLDQRLLTSSYHARLLKTLPSKLPILHENQENLLEEVAKFLNS